MIIKSVNNFEEGKALYEFVCGTKDKFPFKRNHTLPDDAVPGSTIEAPAVNTTFVYHAFNMPARFNNDLVECWVPKNSSTVKTGLVLYKSSNSVVEITDPADVAAVATAIASAYTAKLVASSGSLSDVSAGTTIGTNYQLIPEPSLEAGDHECLAFFIADPTTVRTRPDADNCPTVTIEECKCYSSTSGSAFNSYFNDWFSNRDGCLCVALIPYKIKLT